MVPKGDLKIRVFQDPGRFGYQMQLYVRYQNGEMFVGTDMEMVKIEPGQTMPNSSVFPVDEESLGELGKYLIGQGLIASPVTDRERNEHEQLKIKHEILVEHLAETKDQLYNQTKILGKIAGATKMAQNMIEKLEGK